MKARSIVMLWLRQAVFGWKSGARPYPALARKHRRSVRRLFLYGLLFPDAMHHAIWGVNDDLPSPDELRAAHEALAAEQARRN